MRGADRLVADDRAADIDRPELPADAAGAQPRHVGHQRRGARRRCRLRARRPMSSKSSRSAHGRSLWPSISGVALEDAVDPRLGRRGRSAGRRRARRAAPRQDGEHRYFPHGGEVYEAAAAKRNAAAMWRLSCSTMRGADGAPPGCTATPVARDRRADDRRGGAGARARCARRWRRGRMPRAGSPMRRAMRSIPSWRPARGGSGGRCCRSGCSTGSRRPTWRSAPLARRPDGRVRRPAAAADRARAIIARRRARCASICSRAIFTRPI